MVYLELGTGRLNVFIGGEMIGSATREGEPLYLAGL